MSTAVLASFLLSSLTTVEVHLSAERLMHDGKHERSVAEGHAVLRTSTAVLSADTIAYEKEKQTAHAVGRVTAQIAQRGIFFIQGELLTVIFDGDEIKEVFLHESSAIGKKNVAPEVFLAASPEKAATLGATALLVEGNHLVHDKEKWQTERIDVVPCECDWEHPSWKIRACKATLDTDAERLSILSPVVRIYDVPLFWLPWISFPTTSRQTGLLFPRIGNTVLNGFSYEQPLFITLGRSYDVTFTVGGFFGSAPVGVSQLLVEPPVFEPVYFPYGVQGPRVTAEFRYAPTKNITGRVTAGLLYDFKPVRNPLLPTQLMVGPDRYAHRGFRGELGLFHLQKLTDTLSARVDFAAYSDGFYNRDLTPDVIARESGYGRSVVLLTQRTSWLVATADVTLRQDLTTGYSFFGQPLTFPTTVPLNGPAPIQRFPAFTVSIPTRQLPFGFTWDATLELARLATLRNGTGDEGSDGNEGRLLDHSTGLRLAPLCLNARLFAIGNAAVACSSSTVIAEEGEGDGLWQAGERQGRDRLMLMPRIGWALTPWNVFSVQASLAWRQLLWLSEQSGTASQRGHLVTDAQVGTELTRAFGEKNAFRHFINPVARFRAVPLIVGESPAPYDDIDLSIPEFRTINGRPLSNTTRRVHFAQSTVEVRQRLMHATAGEIARLDIGQGFELGSADLTAARLDETFGRFSVGYGFLSAGANARIDFNRMLATRLTAYAGFDNRQGWGVGIAYDNVFDDGTSRSRSPLDLLFEPYVSPPPPDLSLPLKIRIPTRVEVFGAGARGKVGPISLRYEVSFVPLSWTLPGAALVVPPIPPETKLSFAQHTVTLGFAPACDCWRVEGAFTQRMQPTFEKGIPTGQWYVGAPEFSVSFVSGLGSVRSN